MASSSVTSAAAEVPKTDNNPRRKSSNASSGMDSDNSAGRLLNCLGSVGSKSLPDIADALPDLPKPDVHDDEHEFQVPASVPQHQLKLPGDESNLHVSFTGFPPENESLTSSKGSKHIPERRLPTKKRKMSYESYDSAMGDSYLGLASLDSGALPKIQSDAGSVQGSSSSAQLHGLKISALDHLDHMDGLGEGDSGAHLPAPAPVVPKKPPEGEHKDATSGGADDNSEATFTSSGHRLLMEAIMMTGGLEGGGGGGPRRNRLESWGGMSDLSVHMGPDQGAAAAAITASALQYTWIIDDVTAAANFGGGSVASSVTDDQQVKPSAGEAVPTGRDRTTSFSDSTFPVPSSLDGLEISSDLQKFVAAAVASVGDQLAELAGNIESAAAAVDVEKVQKDDDTRQGSEVSSIATPVVASLLEDPSRITLSGQSSAQVDADVANSTTNVEAAAASAAAIAVDYDAVAAAVDAANAATGGLDLSAIIGEASIPMDVPVSTASSVSSGGGKTKRKRKLPTNKKTSFSHMSLLGDVPKSSLSEKEQEEIRDRARKAAGYVPPAQLPHGAATPAKSRTAQPLKKRMKRATPEPVGSKLSLMATPKISNTRAPESVPSVVVSTIKAKPPGSGKVKEKSTAKWDSMFDCLIQFIAERKKEETAGLSEEDIAEWTWDGNVPTTYKTKDGKALGRWINNQRSAKSNGKLREEREKRLVGAGLKWSVLASNSWNEMLDELRIYIKEYTKDGKKWDGNVPTNYRIKARANGKKMSEEDKNLGRWVNRQRSLYQSGKLREDRQLALEKIGLKWSMLATTSWEAMFETLVAYVEDKKNKGMKWDGNVPANYRTDDNPPRALGRWINRQRSAHVKKKLKQEYVEKLSKLGLKWSVHERKYVDDTQTNTPTKPHPVVSAAAQSCQKVKIPSTIAVPAKKVEPAPAKVSSVRFDESAKKPPSKEASAEALGNKATAGAPAPQATLPTPKAHPSNAMALPPQATTPAPKAHPSNIMVDDKKACTNTPDPALSTGTSLSATQSQNAKPMPCGPNASAESEQRSVVDAAKPLEIKTTEVAATPTEQPKPTPISATPEKPSNDGKLANAPASAETEKSTPNPNTCQSDVPLLKKENDISGEALPPCEAKQPKEAEVQVATTKQPSNPGAQVQVVKTKQPTEPEVQMAKAKQPTEPKAQVAKTNGSEDISIVGSSAKQTQTPTQPTAIMDPVKRAGGDGNPIKGEESAKATDTKTDNKEKTVVCAGTASGSEASEQPSEKVTHDFATAKKQETENPPKEVADAKNAPALVTCSETPQANKS